MPSIYLELVAVYNGHNAIQEACCQARLWNFPLSLPLLHCCSQLFPFLSARRSCCVSSCFLLGCAGPQVPPAQASSRGVKAGLKSPRLTKKANNKVCASRQSRSCGLDSAVHLLGASFCIAHKGSSSAVVAPVHGFQLFFFVIHALAESPRGSSSCQKALCIDNAS